MQRHQHQQTSPRLREYCPSDFLCLCVRRLQQLECGETAELLEFQKSWCVGCCLQVLILLLLLLQVLILMFLYLIVITRFALMAGMAS